MTEHGHILPGDARHHPLGQLGAAIPVHGCFRAGNGQWAPDQEQREELRASGLQVEKPRAAAAPSWQQISPQRGKWLNGCRGQAGSQ
jgi:hypothetical protein